MTLEGGCSCGVVRYRLTREPLFVHCCHCTSCQRETGSAFAINALVEAEAVEVLATPPACVPTPSESGRGQSVWRCPDCRVALWSNYAGFGPAVSFVRVGTLDQAHEVCPDVHIYTRSKVPWVTLPADVPAADEYYRVKELWPPESLERLRALREA